jgi:hypothetical protein
LEQKQKKIAKYLPLISEAYFVTTVYIGEPAQQKLRPAINLSTNNSKAMQLFAMRRCLSFESTIVPNREVRGLNIIDNLKPNYFKEQCSSSSFLLT